MVASPVVVGVAPDGLAAELIAKVWQPRFPSAELVGQVAALLPKISEGATQLEGPRPYIRIGPGVIEVRSKDYARADRTAERAHHQRQMRIEADIAYFTEHGCWPDDPEPTRVIWEWSRKSRARMVATLGMVDYAPMFVDPTRVPAMGTVTYPRCWLTVAPNGRAVKAHMKALRKRYQRAWGEPLRCVWKLEFQGRAPAQRCQCEDCAGRDDGRAPHIHMLLVPPHGTVDGQQFRQWFSATWADIVNHPDPDQRANHLAAGTAVDYPEGLKMSDPKRVAVYFSKHGSFSSKEYQHLVPAAWQEPGQGPGRFWGYWGLEKATAVVQLDPRDAEILGRTARRWASAQGVTRQQSRRRVKGGVPESKYPEIVGLAGAQLVQSRPPPKYRKSRSRVRRMARSRGFLMVNSGPVFVSQLARYLDLVHGVDRWTDRTSSDDGHRLTRSTGPVTRSWPDDEDLCTACAEPLAAVLRSRGRHVSSPGRTCR